MKISDIFTSNMVLPAGKEIRIFGEGEGDVTVSLCGNRAQGVCSDGKWEAVLPPMTYGGPYEIRIELDGEAVTLENVYVGKVYIFAGQSNMQFKLHESSTSVDECEPTELLRLFSTGRLESGEFFFPQDGWLTADKTDIGKWSAIAYLVAEYISRKENVAVGVITCYQGASVIESWLPRGALKKIGIDIPTELKHIDHVQKQYVWNAEGALYENTFLKIAPYSVDGVVWYQGESDTSEAEGSVYAEELSELIRIWRADLRDGELPFIVVQLADLDRRGEAWRLVQEAQACVGESVSNVKTVISRDVCEHDNIHPPTKDALSRRIAEALT